MTPRRVLATYYGIAGVHTLAASLVWGVNTLFLLAAGLDVFEVFLANSAYTAAIVLFEIPTGVVADAFGRRLSFLLSVAALFAATLVYVIGDHAQAGLGVFCLGAAGLGLGATLYSGAVEAWLVDSLREAGHRGPLDAVLARGQALTGATALAGTVAGGLLASVDLSWPYVVRCALLVPLFAYAAVAMKEDGRERRSVRWRTVGRELERLGRASLAYGWRQPIVRGLLVAGLVHYGFLTWAFHAWQPYFLELLGRDAPWVAGVVGALVAGATLAGNALAARLAGRVRRTTVLLAAAAVLTASAVGVGLAGSFAAAVVLLLTTSAAWGVIGPVKQAALHRVIPSRHRATVLSFDSLLGNAGGVGGQSGLGWYARAQSIAGGYVVGGLATVLALPVLGIVRRLKPDGP